MWNSRVVFGRALFSLGLAVSFGFSGTAIAADPSWLIIKGVPHFYEFGSENTGSTSYYWCGHTALKIAEIYVTGNNKKLSEIHDIFKANSPGGYAANGGVGYCNTLSSGRKYCASLQDLAWAQYSRNKGYGRIASTVGTSDTAKLNLKSATNVEAFYKNVKEAIISGYLVISPSTIVYNIAGHFWVIVGYATGKTTDASILYMRNVALSAPSSCPDCLKYGYDTTTTVGEFFRKSANGQMLIVK